MKYKLLMGAVVVAVAGLFASCSDDNDSNPTLIQPTEFVLNTPAYVNQTIDLKETPGLKLSWSQPVYTDNNAPINATYEIQVSPTNKFTCSTAEVDAYPDSNLVADYAIIDKTSTLCSTELSTADLDKALVKVAAWKADAMPEVQSAYIRINAYVLEGTRKLNEIASNVVELKVAPYYIELKDADPIMFYLVGNSIGDGGWSNNPGVSCLPFFIQSDYSYDKTTGAGEITYLNYFDTEGWKIQPADFNWDYGFMSGGSANTAVYRNGAGDAGNIWCDPAGYYKVTIHTGTNTCTIEPQNITPAVYSQVCIAGSFAESNWADVNMTPANKTGENHVWYYTVTIPEGTTAEYKFKLAGTWDVNWGYGTSDGEVNHYGKGTGGGKNIGLEEGTWIIGFNDITGEFSVIAKK